MTLAQSTQVGPYEILSLLGAGGMGEVYDGGAGGFRRRLPGWLGGPAL